MGINLCAHHFISEHLQQQFLKFPYETGHLAHGVYASNLKQSSNLALGKMVCFPVTSVCSWSNDKALAIIARYQSVRARVI